MWDNVTIEAEPGTEVACAEGSGKTLKISFRSVYGDWPNGEPDAEPENILTMPSDGDLFAVRPTDSKTMGQVVMIFGPIPLWFVWPLRVLIVLWTGGSAYCTAMYLRHLLWMAAN